MNNHDRSRNDEDLQNIASELEQVAAKSDQDIASRLEETISKLESLKEEVSKLDNKISQQKLIDPLTINWVLAIMVTLIISITTWQVTILTNQNSRIDKLCSCCRHRQRADPCRG